MASDEPKRGREEEEEADVGPPRPPADADGGEEQAEGLVGPTLPKAKKRKVGMGALWKTIPSHEIVHISGPGV